MKLIPDSKFLKVKYIPNYISLFRLLLIFPIIYLLEFNHLKYIWILLIIAGIADYLDGFIARKLNFKSTFGAIIDPLSDKVLILIPMIWLSIKEIIPYWSLSILLIREFIISALRITKRRGIPAIRSAKYKTFFQFISLIILFSPFDKEIFIEFGMIFYWISFILSIFSLLIYLRIK